MTKAILFASVAALSLAGCGRTSEGTGGAGPDNMAVANVASDDMAANDMAANATATTDVAAAPAMMGADFVNAAASSDMFEIESSKMAIDKAKSADVKAFANMLVADHEKSTAGLKTATGAAKPPMTPAPALNAEQSANIAALKAAAPDAFDQTYISQQIPGHEKALAMLQAYAANGDIPTVKDWAGKTAPVVSQHLARAKELAK